MKKLILFSVLIFSSLALTSQSSSFIFGISGGSNLSKFKNTGDFLDQGETFSRTIGFGGGVDAGIQFGKFAFITGLHYNQRGGESELNLDDPNGLVWNINGVFDLGIRTQEVKYNTLSIPLTLRYTFGQGPLNFTIAAGPTINMINGQGTVNTSFDLVNNGNIGPDETKIEAGKLGDQLFRKSHVGFQFKPGVTYQLNDRGHLTFNMIVESTGNMANDAFLVVNEQGNLSKASGSIKARILAFEVGYEHRIDFTAGTKY